MELYSLYQNIELNKAVQSIGWGLVQQRIIYESNIISTMLLPNDGDGFTRL